ncbi:MAG: hypothetical protein P4L36_12005 [Holophaga sp.]|nr:hypothetical protein [Holophaga sp.]
MASTFDCLRLLNPLSTWDLARKVVGLKVTTLVEEIGKVILRRARDAVTVQPY